MTRLIFRVGHPFFSKEFFVLAFISVQFKRTFRSLRSFPFSAKEHFVLWVHFRSVEMNGKECIVLLRSFKERNMLHSFQKNAKNVAFFSKDRKNVAFF